ncbi:uncharacterized protein sync [Aulostomus maculatus]
MEDLDDSIKTSGFEPLFIQEENGEPDRVLVGQRVESSTVQPGLTFAGTQLNQSALIKPYLQEMDDLLKSCEELTGIPFGSHLSASYNETSLSESIQSKEEAEMVSDGETGTIAHAYLSTSYIDTHMDKAGTEDHPGQTREQGMSSTVNRCGITTDIYRRTDMPLTSAGNKLSDNMVEYEGQLMGMLEMLENCMEEADMDFEMQDWAMDESQEYVHISKKPQFYNDAVPAPTQVKTESLTASLQRYTDQHAADDGVFKESRNQREEKQKTSFSCVNQRGLSVERMEKSGFEEFSIPSMPIDGKENDPMICEAMKQEYGSPNKVTNKEEGTAETDVDEFPPEDSADVQPGLKDLAALASQMEECIEEVQRLEKRRKELLLEVLELRGHKDQKDEEGGSEELETYEHISSIVAELMIALRMEEEGRREERKREIQNLRGERAEEERRMWKVNLERQGLQEELRKLKRRLFSMARDGAQSQAALNTQHREVELLKREEEKLHSLVLQLMEEGSQVKSAHQEELLNLQTELQVQCASQTSNTQDEMTQCKRHSCGDIQQYLQGGLKALEERYEPVLLALVKRKEATAGALVKAKEQAQELRAQLRPLRAEMQTLEIQRTCLEEKLKLIHLQGREDVGQYKETIHYLEESSRELRTELTIQRRKTKEIEELKESLTKQLLLYKIAIEEHKCDHKEKT